MWDEIMDMPGEIFDIRDDYNMPEISYEMNHADPKYCEWIFADGQYIGEIYGTVLEGYELRKVKEIELAAGAAAIDLETIAYFECVCDAKDFVNQAGGL